MKLADEICLVISKYHIATLGEMARLINVERKDRGEHKSDSVFFRLRYEISRIRRNPKAYGFNIPYKFNSYTAYTVILLDRDSVFDHEDDQRRNSMTAGDIAFVKQRLIQTHRNIKMLEQRRDRCERESKFRSRIEMLLNMDKSAETYLKLILGEL